MNRRHFAVRLAGALVSVRCAAFAAEKPPAASPSVAWETLVEFDGNLFVSLLVATAGMSFRDGENPDETVLGDPNGLVGIAITAPRQKASVRLRVPAGKFWEAGEFAGVLPAAAEKYWVAPRLHYRLGALKALSAPQECEVAIETAVDGVVLGTKSARVTVRPMNECVYGAMTSAGFPDKSGIGPMAGFGWLFAAYIDETHRSLDPLLREALATGAVRTFDGFLGGDREQVLLQVFAIWEALTRRKVRCHDYHAGTARSKFVLSQPLRSLDAIAADSSWTSAECVVLFASALLRIGLHPAIVIVSDHVELGVNLSTQGEDWIGLDPTFIGKPNVPMTVWPRRLRDSLPDTLKDAPSLLSFGAAIADATDDIVSFQKQFEELDPHWQMIDVLQARQDGIVSFGFTH